MVRTGVLALQGCIEPHLKHLKNCNAETVLVRTPADLRNVTHLILPGGESTTILKLLHKSGLFSELLKFGQQHAIWGICAGSILIAKEVSHPEQESLALTAIHAVRNHYGSQLDSFEAALEIAPLKRSMSVQFIRAPLLRPLDAQVTVLAQHNGQAVAMQQGRIMVTAFHTELGEDSALHRYFVSI